MVAKYLNATCMNLMLKIKLAANQMSRMRMTTIFRNNSILKDHNLSYPYIGLSRRFDICIGSGV